MDNFKDLLENLNKQQTQAVLTKSRYVRIIAGAGSGKTRVLTTRIAYLIHELGIFGGNILAITFTNKAAKEMQERIRNQLKDMAAGVHISTIHSLCVYILRQDIVSMNIPRNFTVLDQDDQKSILKEAYREIGLDRQKFSFNSMLDYIGNCKGGYVSVERAHLLAGNYPGQVEKAKVYEYYVNRQKALYALDFDDLLLVTVKMFETHPKILERWQRKFGYIHVDEFQDIDQVQYKLISQLAGGENEVYVVGDPDQTIYTWRGADINIIMNFEKDYAGVETIVLNQNYRSDPPILNGANSMIKNNRNRVEKELFTKKEGGELITHFRGQSEAHEAMWVANKDIHLNKEGQPLSTMAILYRANYLSRSLEKSMVDLHVPYVIYGGVRFYDRAEIKDALSYLRLLVSGDDLSFKRIINTPKRKLGQKTIDRIFEAARASDCTMYEAIKNEKLFTGNIQYTIDSFVKMVESWKTKKDILICDLLELVINESGYRYMLEEGKEIERIENLKELINDVKSFQDNNSESTIDEYLQMVNLYTDRTNIDEGNYIQLMTIHAAKGLEFDTVFVYGLSEGIFPSERTMSEGIKGLEEERRLAYVAYTRAKRKLYLTDSMGFSYQMSSPKACSRFVNEIDPKFIEHIGALDNLHQQALLTESKKESQFLNVDDARTRKKSAVFKKGELIQHSVYGSGVIVNIKDGIMEIAFSHPHGIKKILENHQSVTKNGG